MPFALYLADTIQVQDVFLMVWVYALVQASLSVISLLIAASGQNIPLEIAVGLSTVLRCWGAPSPDLRQMNLNRTAPIPVKRLAQECDAHDAQKVLFTPDFFSRV